MLKKAQPPPLIIIIRLVIRVVGVWTSKSMMHHSSVLSTAMKTTIHNANNHNMIS